MGKFLGAAVGKAMGRGLEEVRGIRRGEVGLVR